VISKFVRHEVIVQQCIESRGHILVASVVCTPETAGLGIEYAWGKQKYEHRQANDKLSKIDGGKNFIERVRVLCKDKDILPLKRVYKFYRRTRDYMRLYMEVGIRETGATALSHKEIEDIRKKAKSHRCIMESEHAFLRAN
jgi:hypothetical protein